jgi:lantibiotic biosynthesis protein
VESLPGHMTLHDRDPAMTTWQPLLTGQLAERSWRAVRAIARAVVHMEERRSDPPSRLMFWSYLAGALDERWVADQQDRAAQEVATWLGRGLRPSSLFAGLAGAGWVLAHVSDSETSEEILAIIDHQLELELAAERWHGHFDLISGVVGTGVYLLERCATSASPVAQRCLGRVLDHLIAMSETTADGRAWFTPFELLADTHRTRWPGGHYNCGLAHGNPGVVALLARLASYEPRAEAVAAQAARWLVAQRGTDRAHGRYPAVVGRDPGAREPTRTAWCYGDAGVATALWSAAARLGTPIGPAIELARECATRQPGRCGVVDAGLCHGAVGLAHIFNRCYQSSHDAVFRDAATSWYERALALRHDDRGVGGFLAWAVTGPDQELGWVASDSLLEGAIGIALALLAAIHPVEPAWDRMLLCDLPPVHGVV